MYAQRYEDTLSRVLLAKAFPFHLVLSATGSILALGQSLKRVLRLDSCNGQQFGDHFSLLHPAGLADPGQIGRAGNDYVLVKSNTLPGLLLRGQVVSTAGSTERFFLVAPWVTDIDAIDTLCLTLNDFPPHGPLSDLLQLVKTQETSITDIARSSQELGLLNKELEERVAKRTQALEVKAQELVQSKKVLEREMTERARIEMELRHSQKLEAVGQLAAGVAHEINTPMQYVGNSLQFLKSVFDELDALCLAFEKHLNTTTDRRAVKALRETLDDADLEYVRERAPLALDRALEGITRVTRIVSAMNEFTHPGHESKSPADINQALNTTLTVASSEYKYVARLEKDLQPLPHIPCHLGDLNQVFLNLLVNAAHAIAQRDTRDGLISIKSWLEDDSVHVSIADNGTGIPEQIRHRVFDPFLTTKEVGHGTGQGLAIAHKIIVDKHGGSIRFDSKIGKGTTFLITLPLVDKESNSVTDNPGDIKERAA